MISWLGGRGGGAGRLVPRWTPDIVGAPFVTHRFFRFFPIAMRTARPVHRRKSAAEDLPWTRGRSLWMRLLESDRPGAELPIEFRVAQNGFDINASPGDGDRFEERTGLDGLAPVSPRLNVWDAGVIGGERLLEVASVPADKLTQELAPKAHIIRRVVQPPCRNATSAPPGAYGFRKDLHQPPRIGPGDCLRIEARLLADQTQYQVRVNPAGARLPLDEVPKGLGIEQLPDLFGQVFELVLGIVRHNFLCGRNRLVGVVLLGFGLAQGQKQAGGCGELRQFGFEELVGQAGEAESLQDFKGPEVGVGLKRRARANWRRHDGRQYAFERRRSKLERRALRGRTRRRDGGKLLNAPPGQRGVIAMDVALAQEIIEAASVRPLLSLLGQPPQPVQRARHIRRVRETRQDRKSTRLNSSHLVISYAVFCLKKKKREAAAGYHDDAEK